MENENLTTDEKIFMMSNSYFFLDNKNIKNTKHVIDSIASSIILESYLKRIKNDNRK